VSLDPILSLVSAVGEAVALVLLVRRKIWRNMPMFTIYIFWTLLTDLAAYYIQNYAIASQYVTFYRFEMPVDSILQFGVLVELGWSVLRPVRSVLPRGSLFALAGLVALAGLLIWPLAGMTIPPNLAPESITIIHLEQTFAILRVVCFVVMASFSQILSIGWRDRELQIATGLGFYSIVSLLVTMLHSHQTSQGQIHRLEEVVSFGYLGTLAYWVFSFATKEQERKEFSPQMQQLLVLMSGGARSGSIALTDLPSDRLRKKD
jgi:hypothetical protein